MKNIPWANRFLAVLRTQLIPHLKNKIRKLSMAKFFWFSENYKTFGQLSDFLRSTDHIWKIVHRWLEQDRPHPRYRMLTVHGGGEDGGTCIMCLDHIFGIRVFNTITSSSRRYYQSKHFSTLSKNIFRKENDKPIKLE